MGFKKCVTPRTWVLRGEIEFAPSLGDVYQGVAPEVYKDPDKFFKVTYITYTMREILRNISSVLSGRGGNKVFPLATVFGGGKTHTLIFLYHAVRHPEKIPEGLPRPPKSNVVVLDFTKLEAGPNIRGSKVIYTPWGELAYQLDSYGGLIRELDEKMIPPAEEVLMKLLEPRQPVLILMDEITHYLRRASGVKVGETTLARQTVAFLQSLLAVVRKLERCAIVLTFPEAEAEYEKESKDVAEVVREAGHVILRIASPEQPLTKEELREIIKKWLFEDVKAYCASNTASKYFDYYRERADVFPDEATRPEYKDLMVKSYPFHPTLIDILFERIAAIPRFQRTRGALMLLHRVVQRLYETHGDPELIMPYHIDLSDDRIRSILLRATESEEAQKYVTIIQQDIVNKEGTARAQRVDPELGPKIATCVFFSSFTLAAKDVQRVSPTAKDIALMTCRAGDNPYEILDVLTRLADKLHYMDEAEGRYFFRTRPGLIKLIEDYRNSVTSREIEEEIEDTLMRIRGRSDIFKIVWLEQEYPEDKAEYRIVISKTPLTLEEVKRIYEFKSARGGEFRVNRNSLVLVVPDKASLELAKDAAKTVIAITNLLEEIERVVPEEHVPSYKRRLDLKKKQAAADLSSKVLTAYSYIVYPYVSEKGAVELKHEKMTTQGGTIAEIVERYLENVGKLMRGVSHKWLWDRVISKAIELKTEPVSILGCSVKAIQVKDLIAMFYEDQRLPIVPESAIMRAIREGIGEVFAIANDTRVYLTEKPSIINRSYWILPLESAKEVQKKLEEERIRKEKRAQPPPVSVEEKKVTEEKAKIEEGAVRITISPSEVNVGDIVVGIEVEDRGSLGNLRYLLALVPLTSECKFSISGKRLVLGQGELTISYDGPAKPEPTFNIVDKIDTMLRQLEVIKGEWVEFKATISGLKFKIEEEHVPLIKQIKGKVVVQRRKV